VRVAELRNTGRSKDFCQLALWGPTRRNLAQLAGCHGGNDSSEAEWFGRYRALASDRPRTARSGRPQAAPAKPAHLMYKRPTRQSRLYGCCAPSGDVRQVSVR
jgi:hypothetical protein